MTATVQVRFRHLLADKEVRENTRYNVTEIARQMGVARQALYPWLSGEIQFVRLDTLAAVCRFLECQPGDVLVLVPASEKSEGEAEDGSEAISHEGQIIV